MPLHASRRYAPASRCTWVPGCAGLGPGMRRRLVFLTCRASVHEYSIAVGVVRVGDHRVSALQDPPPGLERMEMASLQAPPLRWGFGLCDSRWAPALPRPPSNRQTGNVSKGHRVGAASTPPSVGPPDHVSRHVAWSVRLPRDAKLATRLGFRGRHVNSAHLDQSPPAFGSLKPERIARNGFPTPGALHRPQAGSVHLQIPAMDLAFAHIPETAHAQSQSDSAGTPQPDQQASSLEDDLQDAYKAISSSAWGIKIGGFFGNVVKQVARPGGPARDASDLICPGRVGLYPGAKGVCRGVGRRDQGPH